MKRVGILLIAVALIAGMVGCGPTQYNLTISSTEGGNVDAPGEGIFTYDRGTMVGLTAEAEDGYRFANWTGNVDTITDTNAAVTNITMNSDYSITAEFVKQYNLTISSTEGGNVTAPGEGTFTYNEGAVVDLVTESEDGYRFANWTGDVTAIANVEAAATNITMNGDYEVTANFTSVTTLWSTLYDSGRSDCPYGIAIDSTNNILVTGSAVAYLNTDTLTLKYDSGGNLSWSKIYNIGSAEVPLGGVAVDSHNNVIIGVTPYAVSLYDYHTVKYNSAGNISWVKVFDSGSSDRVTAVVTDSTDNIVVIGYIHSMSPLRSPIVKYSASSTVLWTKILPLYFMIGELAIDSHDNIILAGSTYNELAGFDYYISKLNPNGNVLWERTYNSGGTAYDWGIGLALDSNDNVIVTGDRVTIKYTPDGDILWMRNVIGVDITIDHNDNILIASGATIKDLPPIGKIIGSGSVITSLNREGDLLWTVSCEDFLKGIVIDSNGDVIVASSTDPSPLGQGDFLITKLRF